MLPAVRPGEIDQLAGGEGGGYALLRLTVQELPARVADRGGRAKKVVHGIGRLRLPIPSEPERPLPALSSPESPPSIVSASACSACSTMRSEEHTSELQSRLHLVCR